MLRAGTVDELAGKVADQLPAVPHAHPATVGDIRHMSYFYVVGRAEGAEGVYILRLDHDGHPFLGFADGKFGSVQAGVLGRHTVQPDVQAAGEFAYGHAHAASSEVVALLDEARDLRTAEEPLQLALFGGITLLHLAAAGLQRTFGVFLGRACGSADSVPAGAAAEQQHHIAGSRALAAHVGSFDGSHYGTYLHAFGSVAIGVDFPHVGGCKAYLVAVAGVSSRSLAADHALGKFAGNRIRHAGGDVPRSGHAHGLIDVGTAGKRVAYCASEAGGGSAERFDFGGMVMGFVLELQQPLLGLAVHGGVDEYAAGVVLFALLLVVQLAVGLQPAGADGCEFHQAERLLHAAEFLAHGAEPAQTLLQFGFQEGIVDGDFFDFGGEGGVAAVVAPVGIQDAELGLERIAALGLEITHDLAEVVGVHGQPVVLAEGGEFAFGHLREAGEVLERLHIRLLVLLQHGEVLTAAFHRVDVVVGYPVQVGLGKAVVEYQQARAFDADVCLGVDQVHAVHGGRCSLVELAGDVFHSQVFLSAEVDGVRHSVGHRLAEYAVAALLHQGVGKAEQVVDVQQPERLDIYGQILGKFSAQALRLNAERFLFLYE